MSRAQQPFASRGRFISGAWLVARWLVVLALVFDQVSAPFHHHQHDGVQAQLELATAHAVLDSIETHADGDCHEFGSHSAMTLRVDASRTGRLPAVEAAPVVSAVNVGLRSLAMLDEPVRKHWERDRSTPDFRSHRSLPPAGRAPPLHA